MSSVPAAEKFLHTDFRGSFPFRIGRLAGAGRNLHGKSGVGAARNNRSGCRVTYRGMPHLEALQRYALLRGEVHHESHE